ncbi:hypothetical protein M569_01733, partial [Genlisea aurea]
VMEWIRGEELGRGSFCTVNLAAARRGDSVLPPLMAVKSCLASQSAAAVRERVILEELKCCPQIVRCLGDSFSYEKGERLYNILLEFVAGGSLADHLKIFRGYGLPEFDVRRYTKQLLKGIEHIHKSGYVHCDIKLQNILLSPDYGVKIADFGLAKRAEGGDSAAAGTLMYMSPEIIASGEQSTASDIWALGCVVSEMASGLPAWRCSESAALIRKIGSGEDTPEIPLSVSEEGRDFMNKCFIKDPTARWTVEMLLDHPFVREVDEIRAVQIATSFSPRCPFDFPEWTSPVNCSITSLPSPSDPQSTIEFGLDDISPWDRIQSLIGEQWPDWSDSSRWIAVR